eukprot:9454622-Pyramimonas_sp.AAC.2
MHNELRESRSLHLEETISTLEAKLTEKEFRLRLAPNRGELTVTSEWWSTTRRHGPYRNGSFTGQE